MTSLAGGVATLAPSRLTFLAANSLVGQRRFATGFDPMQCMSILVVEGETLPYSNTRSGSSTHDERSIIVLSAVELIHNSAHCRHLLPSVFGGEDHNRLG